jgi:fatty-acyl-CoA synthase
METYDTKPQTLAGWVDQHAEQTPDAVGLVSFGVELDWRAIRDRTRRLAARMLALGVDYGDRVAVLSHNRPDVIEVQVACARIGAVFVPLNTRYALEELRETIAAVDPALLFHDQEHAAHAGSARFSGPLLDFDGPSERLRPDHDALSALDRAADRVDGQTPAMILFTSGTTGASLGAVLTHAQVDANHRQFLDTLPIDETTVNYAVAPLFHVAGLNTITGPTVVAGGTNVFAPRFDAGRALRDVEDYGITASFMVPTMWRDIAEHPLFERGAADGLECALVGGARCAPSLRRAYANRDIPFYEGYGMTEAGPMVTVRPPDMEPASAYSVGRAGPQVELRIVDRDARVLPDGARGELEVRAPNVMDRYWQEPAATASTLNDGWLSTGDVGYLRNQQFQLLDRLDDMINTGGEKVYPSQVEAVLGEHPELADLGIVGTDHPRWGEAVTAVVVASGSTVPSLEELRAFGARELAGFKLPKRLEVVAELPRNSAGKLLRREILQVLQREQSAA